MVVSGTNEEGLTLQNAACDTDLPGTRAGWPPPRDSEWQSIRSTSDPNRSPVTVGAIPELNLKPEERADMGLQGYFSDPDNDDLHYSVAGWDPWVVEAGDTLEHVWNLAHRFVDPDGDVLYGTLGTA